MSFWTDLAAGGTSGIMQGIGAMAKDLRTAITGDISPEDKAKIQQKAMDLEMAVQSAQVSMITAEANSADKWTSRARPSFMYVFYIILLTCGVVAPFVGVFFPVEMATFFDNIKKGFGAIPDSMWATFTVGYTGYVGARSFEKYTSIKNK